MFSANNNGPAKVSALMVLLGWIFLAIAFLTSCVAIPVPPFGDRIGEAGTLHVSLKVNYEPRVDFTTTTPELDHAWTEFLKSAPKTLHDK